MSDAQPEPLTADDLRIAEYDSWEWEGFDELEAPFCRCYHLVEDHGEDDECAWCGCDEIVVVGKRAI